MKAFLIAVFLMGLGPLMFWLDGDLASDYGMRGQTLVPANIATSDRRCKSTFFILNQCSFKYQLDGEKHSKNYVIFSLGAPDTVRLLKSTETGELTSTVGQEYFWNRIIAILFFNGISLFVAIAVFASMFGGRTSAQTSPQPQRAAPAAPAGMPAGHGAQAFAANGPQASFGRRNGGGFGQR
ncbi:MAG: hypothetical protein GY948_01115 [Alphaproteobacteria bacterium]|nr:hypothetical protein [Alphaproteobacteria bacterium]